MPVELAYEEHGEGEPAFVLVHGWCCDRTFFAPQVEYFRRAHRVVALDLRGCGASPAPDSGYDVPSLAADVGVLCDRLALERPVLVGHSLGGMIGIELAAQRPERVGAVVAVDPGPIDPLPDVGPRFEALAAAVEGGDGDARRAYVESLFLPHDDPRVRAEVAAAMCRPSGSAAAATLRGVLAWDGAGALRRCTAPLLVILSQLGGSNDPPRLLAHRPDIQVGVTVGAGHFSQLLAPEQVNAMIERFVRVETGTART